jgi:hypothetical protein
MVYELLVGDQQPGCSRLLPTFNIYIRLLGRIVPFGNVWPNSRGGWDAYSVPFVFSPPSFV